MMLNGAALPKVGRSDITIVDSSLASSEKQA